MDKAFDAQAGVGRGEPDLPLPRGISSQPSGPDAAGTTRAPTVAQLRHRAEAPLLIACGALTGGGVLVAALMMLQGSVVPSWAAAAVAGLAAPLLAATVAMRWLYVRQVANGVEVTAGQLPELAAVYGDLIARMGLRHRPRLYVANGNGKLNAWAAKCQVSRGYVVVCSDLLDVAYEHGDWATVRFVLAHELGHVKCGHVDLWRSAIRTLPRLVGLDRSLTRAQEYTADRCAARYAPEGARGLLVLYAGKRVYRRVDHGAYLESVRRHRDGLWLRAVNAWSTHPVGWRRMSALAELDTTGWDTHGRML